MEVLLCYIIIFLVEALILWLYCNDLFIQKHSNRQAVLSLLAMYCLLFFLSNLDIYIFNAVAFFTVNIIFIHTFYDTKWSSALFHAGITTIAMSFGELISFSLFPDFARHFYETRPDINLLIICSFLSKLIYFFIIYILSHLPVTYTNKKTTGGQGALVLVPIPLVTFFVIIPLFMIYFTTDLLDFLIKMIAACCVFLLLINLLIWFFFSYTQKRNQNFIELQLSLMKENDTAEYYKMLSKQNENRSILIHNIRNDLYTISNLAKQNQSAEIINYIDSLIQTSSLQSSDTLQLCKNNTLNAILCRYKEECKKQGISFSIDVLSDSLDFMTTNDLTALFCNLLDNAVESASCVPDSFIDLRIARQENAPFIILVIQNSCTTNPVNSFGKLPTRKKDKLHHGFGMKSIQRTIENYSGDMQVDYDKETKTFQTVIRLSC